MRIAIAHDYLTQRGGAERLLLSIHRAFPEAPIHTLFHEPSQTYPVFSELDIRTGPLNRMPSLRRDPRRALPLLRTAASRMRIDADLVIASSSGWAHAFPTAGRKLVYCHSPARWLYRPGDYLGDAPLTDPRRLALTVLSPSLRAWDQRAAHHADRYLANATVVRERISAIYGIDAATVFPSFSPEVAAGPQVPVPGTDPSGGHHLVVSRLQPYKHVDRVIAAFDQLPGRRLLVVGRGPERSRLRAMAPESVTFAEGLDDAQLRWAYARARSLVVAAHEDFGLTPLEAGAHGVPTVALRAGGYLDTVREGVNGTFFDVATPERIAAAVCRVEGMDLEPERVRRHVEAFSEGRFIAELRDHAAQLLEQPPPGR